jgi:flagellar basal body-associated protein FliL
MFCTKCGKQNKDEAKFCVYCGHSFTGKPQASEAPKAPKVTTYRAEEKKSSSGSKVVIIVVIVLLVAAVLGGVGFAVYKLADSVANEDNYTSASSDDEDEEKSEKKSNKKSEEAEETEALTEEETEPETESVTEEETEETTELEEETEYVEAPVSETEDYIIPYSDSRYLTEEDLAGLTKEQLRLARNEIYARHGRRFNDAGLQSYFDSQEWYNGTIEPDDFNMSVFNDYEMKNKDYILAYEQGKN